jgi:hypothetical protein
LAGKIKVEEYGDEEETTCSGLSTSHFISGVVCGGESLCRGKLVIRCKDNVIGLR